MEAQPQASEIVIRCELRITGCRGGGGAGTNNHGISYHQAGPNLDFLWTVGVDTSASRATYRASGPVDHEEQVNSRS